MSMASAVDQSITAAVEAGDIDPSRHAAAVEALRMMARKVDAIVDAKDNVTFPTMLKYMEALGLLPDKRKTSSDAKPAKSKADLKVVRSKFANQSKSKAVNG